MYLTRHNDNWLPEVFNTLFNEAFVPKAGNTAPAINVIEGENEYTVELAAPGMTRDDFKVTLDADDNLVIDMEKTLHTADNADGTAEAHITGRYLRREFSYTKHHQTLLLPDNVDRDRISATMENGVLTIELPKKTAEQLQKAVKEITIG